MTKPIIGIFEFRAILADAINGFFDAEAFKRIEARFDPDEDSEIEILVDGEVAFIVRAIEDQDGAQ